MLSSLISARHVSAVATRPGAGRYVALAPVTWTRRPDQMGRPGLGGGLAEPAEHLDHGLALVAVARAHRVNGRQQGRAPRGHPDALTATQGGLEVERRGGAKGRGDEALVVLVGLVTGVGDDDFRRP